MAERPTEYYGAPISYISTEAMLGGSDNNGYNFEVVKVCKKGVEAGFYQIPTCRTSRIVKITGDVTCIEAPIEGQSWFMVMRKNGTIESKEFDPENGNWQNVVYGKDDIVVWGAKTNMRAVTFSDRPFTGDDEIPVKLEDLPIEFQNKYKSLKDSSNE